MRRTLFLVSLLLGFGPAVLAQNQVEAPQLAPEQKREVERRKEENDRMQALRQQREEAQDKLINAYTVIMKLQRELDELHATPPQAPPPPK